MAPKATPRKPTASSVGTVKKGKHVAPFVNKKKYVAYTHWIDSAATLVPDIVVSWVTKYNVRESSFIAPMRCAFEESEGRVGDQWGVLAFMHRRDPSAQEGANKYLPGKEGSPFGWEIMISEAGGAKSPPNVGRRIAEGFTTFGADAPEYHISPVFTFRDNLTTNPPKPLNYYLCDPDCMTLLKRVYSTDNTKECVMDDESIMNSYFGSVQLGHRLLEAEDDEQWGKME